MKKDFFRSATSLKRASWEFLRSPKVVAILKLGVAIVGVIHAIEELNESSKIGKIKIGFSPED